MDKNKAFKLFKIGIKSVVHQVAITLFVPILSYLDDLDMFRITWI